MLPTSRGELAGGPRSPRTDGKYDVFVSHAQKLSGTEDIVEWIDDVTEAFFCVAFFARKAPVENSDQALQQAVLNSDVCVTVLDPFTFNSMGVFHENLWAANAGIPIVPVYDADRYRWTGQMAKLCRLYPWVFKREAVALTTSQPSAAVSMLLGAIEEAAAGGRKPPSEYRLGSI